ncbi:hypothetical protein TRFO_27479 [Tritrichomonas foetus]|uniref:Uncharacterized protein n=1 Tax=Tritrichomonas foetus TaxID=1144522 RepID=A0A1J4K0H3_9EUKA|nr:hypothetical protein TRFO_27479 [Tritrichomonas foetus]|eukprot:OHT04921.1 hypothetical protein TRFO_27479 [Tritrichomonas foetus]
MGGRGSGKRRGANTGVRGNQLKRTTKSHKKVSFPKDLIPPEKEFVEIPEKSQEVGQNQNEIVDEFWEKIKEVHSSDPDPNNEVVQNFWKTINNNDDDEAFKEIFNIQK